MIYFSFYPNYKNNLNVNGNAVLTEKITKKFFNKKKDVIVNTTSSNMFLTKLRKFFSYFIVIYHIIFKRQKNLYTVLLDHHGFYFHTLFFFIFQYLLDSVVIYHHSFRYINKKYYLLNLLKNKKFIHIATSQKQLLKLKKFYGIKKIYLIENNFILLGKKKKLIKMKNKLNIIYFSALIKSKGIYDYIKIAKKFYNHKNLKFSIYGNHCSPELYKKLSNLMNENIISEFKINIHGAAKTLMYQKTDVLLFPSKHPPETTPLVIDECIDNLIIPISYNIGDVKQMIGTTNLICENLKKMEEKLLYVAKNIFSYKKRIYLLKQQKIDKSFKYSCLLSELLSN